MALSSPPQALPSTLDLNQILVILIQNQSERNQNEAHFPTLTVEVCLVLAPDANFLIQASRGYHVGVVFLSSLHLVFEFLMIRLSRQIYAVPDLCCIVIRRLVESVGGVLWPCCE